MPAATLPQSPYDVTGQELLRRRRLAQLLQEQSLSSDGAVPVTHRVSALNPLAKMAQALAGVYMNKQAGEEEGKLAQDRESAFQTGMAAMPRGTPEQVGTGPIAPEQGEFLPNVLGKQPTPEEMLSWSHKVRGTTPAGDEIGKLAATNAMSQMLPKNPMDLWKTTAAGDLYTIGPDGKPQFTTGPMTEAKFKETQAVNEANAPGQADALQAKIEQGNLDRASREAMAADRNALLAELARMRAEGAADRKAGQAGTWTTVGVDEKGNTVRMNNKTNETSAFTADGKPAEVAGGVQVRHEAEKGAKLYRESQAALDASNALIKEVEAAGPISPARSGAVLLAEKVGAGGLARDALYTKEQQEAQAKTSLKISQVMNQLFGAAQSAGESARAAGFEFKESDPMPVKIAKMRGLQALVNEKVAGVSPNARSLAGGGAAAPGGLASKYGLKE